MHMTNSACGRRGSALIAAIALIMVLFLVTTSLTSLTISSFEQQQDRKHALETQVASESAANVAYYYLQDNYRSLIADGLGEEDASKTVDLSSMGITDMNGTSLAASVSHMSGTTDDDYVFLIEGTATQGEQDDGRLYVRNRVQFTVRTVVSEIFNQAMFAIEGYDFIGSAETDSWDSSVGSYDPDAASWNGDLGSEGSIYVPDNKQDDPDDPSDDPDVKGAINDNQEFPIPVYSYTDMLATYPPVTTYGLLDTSAITGLDTDGDNSTNTLYLSSANSPYKCSGVDAGNKDVINISGEVRLFVDGPFDVKQTEFVYADSAASLTIYQNDYDDSTGDTGFTLNGNDAVGKAYEDPTDSDRTIAEPSKLIFFTEYDGLMTMNGNGLMAGVLFAPNATLKLNGTFDYYGSIIARAFSSQVSGTGEQGKVNGTYSFHYDESLKDLDLDLLPRLVMVGWRSFPLTIHED